jgi:hypothetical protein
MSGEFGIFVCSSNNSVTQHCSPAALFDVYILHVTLRATFLADNPCFVLKTILIFRISIVCMLSINILT